MHYPIAITAWHTLWVKRLPWVRMSSMKEGSPGMRTNGPQFPGEAVL